MQFIINRKPDNENFKGKKIYKEKIERKKNKKQESKLV